MPAQPPTGPHVASVNVGTVQDVQWAGRTRRSAIDKRPVTGVVQVGELGLGGDAVGNTKHHGGPFQAVYAFAREDLDHWAAELGEPLRPGFFGENLTTAGLDVNEAVLGERWRIGSALLEVVSVRTPCNVFAGWVRAHDLDASRWARRFTATDRPGPYLRVLEAGALQADDPVHVEHRPDHGVTVSTMFRALTTDRTLLPLLADLDRIDPQAREAAERYVAGARRTATG